MPDYRESDWGIWFPTDDRDTEVERLRRELRESRGREQIARRDAADTRKRFDRLLESSRRFTHTLRDIKVQQHMGRRRLFTQQAVGLVLAEARDLSDAGSSILEILGENLGWSLAVLWTPGGEPGGDGQTLRCEAVWHRTDFSAADFEAACRKASFSRGEGLPGRAWKKNRAVWAGDLGLEDSEGGFREEAVAAGLRGALAFPITSDSRTFGVIELLGDEVLRHDKSLLYTVGLVGSRLGQFAERRRAEEELRRSEAWLRQATEAGRVGLLDWDLRTDESRCSGAMAEIFGFPPGEYAPSYEGFLGMVHPEDLGRVRRTLDAAVAAGAAHELKYRIVRPDGAVRWVYAQGQVYLDADGTPARVLGVAQDITEQQQAEWERGRLHSLEVATRAEAAERGRISRELHDRVAHLMGVAHQSLLLYEALAEKDPQRADERLQTAKETTRTAMEATRNLSMELRRSETENGLGPALRDLLTVAVPESVHTKLSVSGDESLLTEHLRGQLYLTLREAVRNSVKHSGCDTLTVGLSITPKGVSGRVEDDGCGFDSDGRGGNGGAGGSGGNGGSEAGLGLRSMEERAGFLEGSVKIESSPGGTEVQVYVPLRNGG